MKAIRVVAATCVALAGAAALHASGPIAVYARVEKVARIIEPGAPELQRIQISGVFSIAAPDYANTFLPPARGYLYYVLPSSPTNRQAALSEWDDLKAVAGTGQIVAFGAQWQGTPRLRPADQRPESPDPYTLNVGIRKINGNTDYAPVRALIDFKP
jgi:hypothetical protein